VKLQFKHIPVNFGVVLGVLGSLTFFLGFVIMIPAIISMVYGDGIWWAFILTGVGSSIVGGLAWRTFKPEDEVHTREAFLIVALTWLVVSLVGAFPFWISGVLETYTDAVFETMSGFSTTGATIFGGARPDGIVNPLLVDIPESLLFWRSLTHWLGGMGIIVLTIAILPLLGIGGMQLYQAETPGPTADKLTPRVQQTAKLLWLVYAGFTLVLFFLLWIHPSVDWFDALNHAFSTMATGGFSTYDNSIIAFNSVYVEVVITIFMFLAGVSFALHFRLFRGEVSRFFNDREFRFYSLIVGSAILFVTAELMIRDTYTMGESLRYASFQVVSIITTTGFASNDYELWPYFAQFTLLLLFFAGGCAGSTAGGMKMIRWLILVKNNIREVRQIIHPKAILPIRVGNKVIDPNVQRTVLSFFVFYIVIFLLGAFALALTGEDLVSALSASISSLGNIGPSFGQHGPSENYAITNDIGKWVMVVLMMVGRLELFTVIVLFSRSFWKQ
jgi:trk system potassium uptake protein